MSRYGVFSGPYFPLFGLNTGKYRPEKSPYLNTFHAVTRQRFVVMNNIAGNYLYMCIKYLYLDFVGNGSKRNSFWAM